MVDPIDGKLLAAFYDRVLERSAATDRAVLAEARRQAESLLARLMAAKGDGGPGAA